MPVAKTLRGFRYACLVLLACASPAFAGDPRDIVFDCPCRAEWTPGPGEGGELTLEFGVRSHRATDSGEVRLIAENITERRVVTRSVAESAPSLGQVRAGSEMAGQHVTLRLEAPTSGEAIHVLLMEQVGDIHGGSVSLWQRLDYLALWPAQTAGDGRIEFVDILTDTDGDGVGDLNEKLAGGSPESPAARPEGSSTIDVLALYNGGFREEFGGYPHTRIHHVMTLTDALFADNGTNVRIRTVGMSEVGIDERGLPEAAHREELLERHGADLSLQFHGGDEAFFCGGASGCANLGAFLSAFWDGDRLDAFMISAAGAITAAHELGHNLGLAHSDRQGETYGAFRWSRGHYIDSRAGTIMSYGFRILGGVFSDPAADCLGAPCGVPADEPAGADAVRSLDLLRWQASAHRAAKPDSDGDGIVDAGDALPNDPAEYVDTDGDGVGDNADDDDDNDGVPDGEDAFPADPDEWADADGDGIGDNADDSVANLDPFRDPALRAAIEAALGKAPGEPITEAELLTLTTLDAPWGAGIRNLTGLELAGNLETLDVAGNRVSDLKPLAGLSALGHLNVSDNAVSDLTPLADLSSLGYLNVSDNAVSDLAPLADLSALWTLSMHANAVSDLTPLAGLSALRNLYMTHNAVSDLSPLVALSELRNLDVSNNPVADVAPLADLSALRWLAASSLDISDLAFLSPLAELFSLNVSGNPVADLSPLRPLVKLRSVNVYDTNVGDLSPLSELDLYTLDAGHTGVTINDVVALPKARQLTTLSIDGLGVGKEDLGALSGFGRLRHLSLRDNRISDVSSLAALRGLRSLHVGGNLISDIGPLARREIWDLEHEHLNLYAWRNPLDRASLLEHIPRLEAWGVAVYANVSPSVAFPDPVLRRLVSRAVAGGSTHVDDPITETTVRRLRNLHAFNAGVSDLTGLEAALRLRDVFLGANAISDLTPLGDLPELELLDLSDNRISDLSPLVGNPAIGAGDSIVLDGNPLSEESLNAHVPALLSRGVSVGLDSILLRAPLDGGTVSYRVSGYFAALVEGDAAIEASSDDPDVASAAMDGGRLRLTPGAEGGRTTVAVTARGTGGSRATLTFLVSFVERPRALAELPTVALGAAGDAAEIGLAELFAGDGPLTFEARSSDPALVVVEVLGGVLTIRSLADEDDEGVVSVTVTATDIGGLAATLTLEVAVDPIQRGLLRRGWFRAWLGLQPRGDDDAGE